MRKQLSKHRQFIVSLTSLVGLMILLLNLQAKPPTNKRSPLMTTMIKSVATRPRYDNDDSTRPTYDYAYNSSTNPLNIPPLRMKGGDPYIRALMRTITASESYDASPYTIIYGGQHISDLSRHPEICITIKGGPNAGNCSTAAGRYQFINTTWYQKAELYHPKGANNWSWKEDDIYSFEPQYQDAVVYGWLSDPQAWGVDLSQLLQNGQIHDVLRRLSPTWTSLGYGIETNSMSHHLPTIYQNMLQEELRLARS
ncbi:MAG: glycoside hydrolase [Chroococcales cyanobacterium]